MLRTWIAAQLLCACVYRGRAGADLLAPPVPPLLARLQCIQEEGSDDPPKCKPFADDYLECLHHRKYVSGCRAVADAAAASCIATASRERRNLAWLSSGASSRVRRQQGSLQPGGRS
jgi:hypothetical protein